MKSLKSSTLEVESDTITLFKLSKLSNIRLLLTSYQNTITLVQITVIPPANQLTYYRSQNSTSSFLSTCITSEKLLNFPNGTIKQYFTRRLLQLYVSKSQYTYQAQQVKLITNCISQDIKLEVAALSADHLQLPYNVVIF